MRIASLFSGIGGLELGLHTQGFDTRLFCENDTAAQAVLSAHFPHVPIHDDVRTLRSLPQCDVLTAGFPCQDLSLAGDKAGLKGSRSGLVSHVLRLVNRATRKPNWLLIENVPYMLLLDKGSGMASLTDLLEDAGYSWAYRVVDARSFGLPQRRRRVILLASRRDDPREVLFADDSSRKFVEGRPSDVNIGPAYGFYWTMGKMGAGWAREATPPIKGGSGIGIPSPPAIWLSSKDFFGTPQIEDAERLQGFEAGWTEPVLEAGLRASTRWRLIGNAVCPPMAEWVATRLLDPDHYDASRDAPLAAGKWPRAAYGMKGKRSGVEISEFPFARHAPRLRSFLSMPLKPLSLRATVGFRSRAMVSREIAWAPEFIESLATHIEAVRGTEQREAA